MKFATSLLFFLSRHASAEKDDDGVEVLTTENWKQFIDENPQGVLVELYAPWCGHCKAFAPQYAKLPAEVLNHDELKEIKIAKADGDAHSEIMEELGASSFPTIFFFKTSATKFQYEGERGVDELVSYMKDMIKPALKKVADSDVEALKKERTMAQILMVARTNDEGHSAVLASIADSNRGRVTIAHIESGDNSVTAYSGLDEVFTHSGDFSHSALEAFVHKAFPLYGKVDEQNFEHYLNKSHAAMVWACFDPKNVDGHAADNAKHFAPVAKWLKDNHSKDGDDTMHPTVLFIDTDEFSEHAESELGCEKMSDSEFTVAVQVGDFSIEADDGQLKKYRQAFKLAEASSDAIMTFVKDALEGKAETLEDKELDLMDDDEEEEDDMQDDDDEEL